MEPPIPSVAILLQQLPTMMMAAVASPSPVSVSVSLLPVDDEQEKKKNSTNSSPTTTTTTRMERITPTDGIFPTSSSSSSSVTSEPPPTGGSSPLLLFRNLVTNQRLRSLFVLHSTIHSPTASTNTAPNNHHQYPANDDDPNENPNSSTKEDEDIASFPSRVVRRNRHARTPITTIPISNVPVGVSEGGGGGGRRTTRRSVSASPTSTTRIKRRRRLLRIVVQRTNSNNNNSRSSSRNSHGSTNRRSHSPSSSDPGVMHAATSDPPPIQISNEILSMEEDYDHPNHNSTNMHHPTDPPNHNIPCYYTMRMEENPFVEPPSACCDDYCTIAAELDIAKENEPRDDPPDQEEDHCTTVSSLSNGSARQIILYTTTTTTVVGDNPVVLATSPPVEIFIPSPRNHYYYDTSTSFSSFWKQPATTTLTDATNQDWRTSWIQLGAGGVRDGTEQYASPHPPPNHPARIRLHDSVGPSPPPLSTPPPIHTSEVVDASCLLQHPHPAPISMCYRLPAPKHQVVHSQRGHGVGVPTKVADGATMNDTRPTTVSPTPSSPIRNCDVGNHIAHHHSIRPRVATRQQRAQTTTTTATTNLVRRGGVNRPRPTYRHCYGRMNSPATTTTTRRLHRPLSIQTHGVVVEEEVVDSLLGNRPRRRKPPVVLRDTTATASVFSFGSIVGESFVLTTSPIAGSSSSRFTSTTRCDPNMLLSTAAAAASSLSPLHDHGTMTTSRRWLQEPMSLPEFPQLTRAPQQYLSPATTTTAATRIELDPEHSKGSPGVPDPPMQHVIESFITLADRQRQRKTPFQNDLDYYWKQTKRWTGLQEKPIDLQRNHSGCLT
jgi:hypothetical protein